MSEEQKRDLFKYLDNAFDMNPDAKIYSIICQYCRDKKINIFLPDVDKIGFEYLINLKSKG